MFQDVLAVLGKSWACKHWTIQNILFCICIAFFHWGSHFGLAPSLVLYFLHSLSFWLKACQQFQKMASKSVKCKHAKKNQQKCKRAKNNAKNTEQCRKNAKKTTQRMTRKKQQNNDSPK